MLLRLALLTKMAMNQPKSSISGSLLSYETSSDSQSGDISIVLTSIRN